MFIKLFDLFITATQIAKTIDHTHMLDNDAQRQSLIAELGGTKRAQKGSSEIKSGTYVDDKIRAVA